MSVYTTVTEVELMQFMQNYKVGKVISYAGYLSRHGKYELYSKYNARRIYSNIV